MGLMHWKKHKSKRDIIGLALIFIFYFVLLYLFIREMIHGFNIIAFILLLLMFIFFFPFMVIGPIYMIKDICEENNKYNGKNKET